MSIHDSDAYIYCDKSGDIERLRILWSKNKVRLLVYHWGEDAPLIQGALTPPQVGELIHRLTDEVDRNWRKEVNA